MSCRNVIEIRTSIALDLTCDPITRRASRLHERDIDISAHARMPETVRCYHKGAACICQTGNGAAVQSAEAIKMLRFEPERERELSWDGGIKHELRCQANFPYAQAIEHDSSKRLTVSRRRASSPAAPVKDCIT